MKSGLPSLLLGSNGEPSKPSSPTMSESLEWECDEFSGGMQVTSEREGERREGGGEGYQLRTTKFYLSTISVLPQYYLSTILVQYCDLPGTEA